MHDRDQRADAVARARWRARRAPARGRCRSPAPARATASPPRSPARRCRCRDRGCGAAGVGAPARRAPAGSRAWCRDGRCRRPCAASISMPMQWSRHAVAVVRAVHDETAGGDRPQSDQASLHPVARRRPSRPSARPRAASPPASAISARRPRQSGGVAEMHVDLPAAVRPREGGARRLGRIEALGQQVGDAAGRALRRRSGGRRRLPRRRRLSGLCSQRFMHRRGAIFHSNYQQDIPRLIRPLGAVVLALTRLIHSYHPEAIAMDTPTRSACAELVQAWGFARDQGRWDDLLAIFHPGGEIARVLVPRAVHRIRRALPAELRQRHRGQAPAVAGAGTVNGDARRCRRPMSRSWCGRPSRASRPISPPTAASSTGWSGATATGAWSSAPRVYEKDRLDPVEPSAAFDALMAGADAAKYPAPYRYMGYRVHAAGRTLAEPVHYDGRAETEALKARYAAWLTGSVSSHALRHAPARARHRARCHERSRAWPSLGSAAPAVSAESAEQR